MKVQLPMSSPLFTTYPALADITAIIRSDERFPRWICNNFNQLIYYTNASKKARFYTFIEDIPRESNTIFSDVPILRYNLIQCDLLNAQTTDIVAFLKNCVDSGYYVRIFMDNYYISYHKWMYGRLNFVHQKLVYGYDDETEVIYMSDFANGNRYNLYTASYDEVRQAYSACFPLPDSDSRYVVCVKPREQKLRQEINYEKIAADLNDFLTSSDRTRRLLNSERWSGYLFTYGIKCYDQMISDIKRGVADAKSMNMFCDYVTSMECTVDEIKSSGNFDSDETYYRLKGQLVTMRNQAMTARNLLLKYSVKNHGDLSDSDIGALVKHYTDFRNTSEAFAKELIKALDYPVLKHSLSESEYDMANADELGLFLPETKWSDCVHRLEKRYSGSINIEFDITPLRASNIFFLGFAQADKGVSYFYDIPFSVRLWDKEGCFEAYDDVIDRQDKAIFPVMGQTYHVEMNVEFERGTYDAYVTNADSERVRIAGGYRFRSRAPEPEYIDSVVFVSVKRDDGFAENLRINGDAVSFGKLNTERLSGALEYDFDPDNDYGIEILYKLVDDSSGVTISFDSAKEMKFSFKAKNLGELRSENPGEWRKASVMKFGEELYLIDNDDPVRTERFGISADRGRVRVTYSNALVYGGKAIGGECGAEKMEEW